MQRNGGAMTKPRYVNTQKSLVAGKEKKMSNSEIKRKAHLCPGEMAEELRMLRETVEDFTSFIAERKLLGEWAEWLGEADAKAKILGDQL